MVYMAYMVVYMVYMVVYMHAKKREGQQGRQNNGGTFPASQPNSTCSGGFCLFYSFKIVPTFLYAETYILLNTHLSAFISCQCRWIQLVT